MVKINVLSERKNWQFHKKPLEFHHEKKDPALHLKIIKNAIRTKRLVVILPKIFAPTVIRNESGQQRDQPDNKIKLKRSLIRGNARSDYVKKIVKLI